MQKRVRQPDFRKFLENVTTSVTQIELGRYCALGRRPSVSDCWN